MRPLLRPAPLLLSGVVLLGSALIGASGTPAVTHDLRPAFGPGCTGYCKYPTNAAKVFRWGNAAWHQDFVTGSLNSHWKSNHPGLIGQQHGMLTIHAGPGTRLVRVWPDNQSARYGRWEARVRAVNLSTGARPYDFVWELVPTSHGHCGGRSIVLSSYHPGDRRVHGSVRALPHLKFAYSRTRDLRSRAWHTYAVEITRSHISWFVDTKVMRTERRPAALTGVRLRPQFRIKAARGRTMNESMMQMDWVRYYDLHRPNAHSIKAPRMHRTRYAGAC